MGIRIGLMSLFLLSNVFAAELKTETVKAWDDYIDRVEARQHERMNTTGSFLWLDEQPQRLHKARAGQIVVWQVNRGAGEKVPNGLIHDWIGGTFLPDAKLAEVMAVVRDYERYPKYYSPTVIGSRLQERNDAADKFSLTFMNQSLVVKMALDTDYEASFVRLNEKRLFGKVYATRIQEIRDYGHENQHALPVGQGTGYIWRLYSVSRFEERDGGVYVELEAIALSRDIPGSVKLFVEPIVRRVSRNSITESLRQTGDAVTTSLNGNTESSKVSSAETKGSAPANR